MPRPLALPATPPDAAARRRTLAAARAKRARERRRAGMRVVPVEVDDGLVAQLVDCGLLEKIDAADPAALAFALGLALEEFFSSRVTPGN